MSTDVNPRRIRALMRPQGYLSGRDYLLSSVGGAVRMPGFPVAVPPCDGAVQMLVKVRNYIPDVKISLQRRGYRVEVSGGVLTIRPGEAE